MKLIALCGAAGAGKDTVADMLPARKLAFADVLYREVAEAFGETVEWLQRREFKEVLQWELRSDACKDEAFCGYLRWAGKVLGYDAHSHPRSPRQILQWWGDYRRAQDPDYFVQQTAADVAFARNEGCSPVVITDVRFPNEAALVRQLGGQLWQIRRPGYEAGRTGHVSDTDGSEFGPDRVLVNNGDLDDLRADALMYWEAA